MLFIFNAPNKVKENSNIFLFLAIYIYFYTLCCQLFWECIVAEIRIKKLKMCKCNTDADIEKNLRVMLCHRIVNGSQTDMTTSK